VKFKLGYSGLRWTTPDLDYILSQLKETGWDGWEIRQSLDWLGSASRVKKVSDRAGIPVAVVTGGSISLDNNYEMMERNKRRIDFAADVEADTFMFMGATRPYGEASTTNDIQALAELSDTFADYASQYDLDVCYHIHTSTTVDSRSEWELLMRLMTKSQLCIDVSHSAFWHYDPEQSIRDFKDRLVYIHLQDYKDYRFVELGEGGLVNFGLVMKALEEIQYDRWVTVCPSQSDLADEEKMRRDRAYLQQLGY
tara:strand:- start:7156 stop:7914 length:759 start_codon:yes stop_codon:yes gene_type:complete